jgi:hypothetical protein
MYFFDIFPALKGESSPKGTLRLHVSSGAKYAFASSLTGSRPIMTTDVRCSALSRVKAAFLPICNGRFIGTEYRPSLRGRVFSLLGTTINVSRPDGPGVVDYASTLLPERVRRQSRRTVKDRNSILGNVGSIDTAVGRLILPFVEYSALLSTGLVNTVSDSSPP